MFVACFALSAETLQAAESHRYRTENFRVTAPTLELARAFARRAEDSRDELSRKWFGRSLPKWDERCSIRVRTTEGEVDGATSYAILRGRVVDLEIELRGDREKLLESVLPHEVMHAVVVTRFGRALPRWADEGIAMSAETEAVLRRQRLFAAQAYRSGQGKSLRGVLETEEYPRDRQQVMLFYACSLTVTEYLVARDDGGTDRFLAFLRDAGRDGWDEALNEHYGFDNVESLEAAWTASLVGGDDEFVQAEPERNEKRSRRSRRRAETAEEGQLASNSSERTTLTRRGLGD